MNGFTRGAFGWIRLSLFFLMPLSGLGCSTALEATFEITTRGVERTVTRETVALNPRGDSLELPRSLAAAGLTWNDGRHALAAGDRVAIVVETLTRAPGRRTRVLVNDREIAARDGGFPLSAWWRVEAEKTLPPVVWTQVLELEPGQALEVDQTVMYACADRTKFVRLETAVRFTGEDRNHYAFAASGPFVRGHVTGVIKAGQQDGKTEEKK